MTFFVVSHLAALDSSRRSLFRPGSWRHFPAFSRQVLPFRKFPGDSDGQMAGRVEGALAEMVATILATR